MSTALIIDEEITLPAGDFAWTAVRASGSGGQNVNKVSSKIQLTFDFEATLVLSDVVKARLRVIARNSLDAEGRLLVVSQKTRDQAKNLEDARDKVRELVQKALFVPKKRRPTKPTKGSKVRRVVAKKQVGQKKATRRAVRHDDE